MTPEQLAARKAEQIKSGNAARQENVFIEFLAKYENDPVLFVREVLGAEPDEWQLRALKRYGQRKRRLSWRSGHGVGKTTTLAWIIVHHTVCRFPQKTVCTAPTSKQLFDALASETKKWFKQMPADLGRYFDIKSESIVFLPAPDESFVSFRTSSPETPEALAGVHSDWVLLICDEASGIPESVFEAAGGSMSGHNACTIMAGNPIRSTGTFFESHDDPTQDWDTMHISCLSTPRVTADYIDQQKRKYGENSNVYRVRVLGEFPLADDDAVIGKALLDAALVRDVAPKRQRPIWGADIARKGRDKSALAKRMGNVLMEETKEWDDPDLMVVAGRIKLEYDTTPEFYKPSSINIDAIGLGAGVADRLREQGLPAFAINVSETSSVMEPDKYINLRSELWFMGRQWFEKKDVAIHGKTADGVPWADKQLAVELGRPIWEPKSNGKIQVEGKKEMVKRLKKPSPNRADAFLLTFASPAVALQSSGTDTTVGWNQPIPFEIKGLV